MSKNISVTAVLVALLLLVTALFGAFALTHSRVYNTMRNLQTYARGLEAQRQLVLRNRALFAAMLNDAAEYGKKSPAMAALIQQYAASLEQFGVHPKTAATGAPKSAP